MLQEFADIKRKYAILQDKLKAKGPPKVTLQKVKQLKEEAEKLAEETEKKIRRITGNVLFLQQAEEIVEIKLKAFPTDICRPGSPEIGFKIV